MKIFSWMHDKIIRKQEPKNDISAAANTYNTWQNSQREEFSDWPHGLLAIGTFGNTNLKPESEKSRHEETETTSNQVKELQKEITQLFDEQVLDGLLDTQNPRSGNVSVNLDCERLERSNSVVLNREKDMQSGKKKGSIRKKWVTFILKKMLMCRGGFVPSPSLRDPIPDKSIIEKILRDILQKKIYPQNSNPKAMAKKYIDTNQILHNSDSDDETIDMENDGCKWVKTDSDYIVLEI